MEDPTRHVSLLTPTAAASVPPTASPVPSGAAPNENVTAPRDAHLYPFLRLMLDTHVFDRGLPPYEQQVVRSALQSAQSWDIFVRTSTPQPAPRAHAETSQVAADISLRQTPTPRGRYRTKRAASFGRRRAKQPEIAAAAATADKTRAEDLLVQTSIETLHDRLRHLLFDQLVDCVLAPMQEPPPESMPLDEETKQAFGLAATDEPTSHRPYLTLEDLDEMAKDGDTLVLPAPPPKLPVALWSPQSEAAMATGEVLPFPAAPGTPMTPGPPPRLQRKTLHMKRKYTLSRELRNLLSDVRPSRKNQRLNMLDASQELKTFSSQLDDIVAQLQHLDEEGSAGAGDEDTALDWQSFLRHMTTKVYFSRASFQADLDGLLERAQARPDVSAAQACRIQAVRTLGVRLMEGLPNQEFTEEEDSMRDMLSQIFPDSYTSEDEAADTRDRGGTAGRRVKTLDLLPRADGALDRDVFYFEDMCRVSWRVAIARARQKEAEPGVSMIYPRKHAWLRLQDYTGDEDDLQTMLQAGLPHPEVLPFFWRTSHADWDGVGGGQKSDGQEPKSSLALRTLGPKDSYDLLERAILVWLMRAGFQGAREAAVRTLTDVLITFIHRIGFLNTTFLGTTTPASAADDDTPPDYVDIVNQALIEAFPASDGLISLAEVAAALPLQSQAFKDVLQDLLVALREVEPGPFAVHSPLFAMPIPFTKRTHLYESRHAHTTAAACLVDDDDAADLDDPSGLSPIGLTTAHPPKRWKHEIAPTCQTEEDNSSPGGHPPL